MRVVPVSCQRHPAGGTGGRGPGRQPAVAWSLVSFRPDALRGAPTDGLPLGGHVTYRLARNSVVSEYRKGRLSRLDVCDAHPELIRAATGVGEETAEPCPICEEQNVVLVSYAFGPGLPAGGRCVASKADVTRATRSSTGDVACYVVEVCPTCRWNHLAQTFVVTGRRRARA
jgi:hypothetical protein